MEEILASIRRIIEDNDQPRDEPDFDTVESAIGPAANDPARSDVFARTVESAPQPADPVPASEALTSPVEPEIDAAAMSAAIEEEARLEVATRWDHAALRSLDEKAVASSAPAFQEVQQPAAPEPVQDSADSRSGIVSEATGRQVAASFGELTEAFAASRRRSFDEIAEEMMRPMLQDWLDNNLPTLVEKLVREEIERVARGG